MQISQIPSAYNAKFIHSIFSFGEFEFQIHLLVNVHLSRDIALCMPFAHVAVD